MTAVTGRMSIVTTLPDAALGGRSAVGDIVSRLRFLGKGDPWRAVRGFATSTTARGRRSAASARRPHASVREKWLDFSPEFLSLYAKWDPGMIVQPHGHNSNHVVFVLEGEMTCGDVRCPAGTHIALDQGDTFGPFVAGPNGVELFEVMMGDPRSFPADLEGYERFLAERDVQQLPNPPIDMPDWLEDTRSDRRRRHASRSTASTRSSGTSRSAPAPIPTAARGGGAQGVARKLLAQGDAGFYAQVVRFPPDFEAPVHSHDHAEIFMVLEGSCDFDGAADGAPRHDGRRRQRAVRVHRRARRPVVPRRAHAARPRSRSARDADYDLIVRGGVRRRRHRAAPPACRRRRPRRHGRHARRISTARPPARRSTPTG